ncbi:MAG: molybdopterin-dependent oxidoreductase [Thermoprotei archaeon]
MIACTRDCYDTCIFDENFRPIKGEPTFGFTCSRGNADLRRNERNRLSEPLIEGKPASMEEAVRVIVRIVKGLRPEEVLHVEYDGNQGLLTWYYPARFWNVIGSASTDYSICSSEGHLALQSVWGCSCGAGLEDFKRARAFVLWGSNASVSFVHGWYLMKDKYKVVVDVWNSETARKAEKKYIIKPSSDPWLALGVLKVLINNGMGDLRHVDGSERLLEVLSLVTLDDVTRYTGLSEEEIVELAELYYYYEPLTVIGFAIGRTIDGFNAVQLISLIPAVLGLGRWFYYSNTYSLGIDFAYLRGLHLAKPSRVVGMAEVGKEVREGKVKAIFVWNSNPVLTLPMGDEIREAVEEGKLFLAVHDPFLTETVKAANVAVPAPTYLEKHDVVYSYWHNYLVYNEPVRPRRGYAEVELMRALAKEYGVSHPLLDEDPWEAVDRAIRGAGVSLEELRRRKVVKVEPKVPNVRPNASQVRLPRVPEGGTYLVFTSHPNSTNTQFAEVYGYPDQVLSGEYEGELELSNDLATVKVRAAKSEHVPKGVIVAYKPSLRLNLNSLVPPLKGRSGTPPINSTVVRVMKVS